jgi:hypothetical protein
LHPRILHEIRVGTNLRMAPNPTRCQAFCEHIRLNARPLDLHLLVELSRQRELRHDTQRLGFGDPAIVDVINRCSSSACSGPSAPAPGSPRPRDGMAGRLMQRSAHAGPGHCHRPGCGIIGPRWRFDRAHTWAAASLFCSLNSLLHVNRRPRTSTPIYWTDIGQSERVVH